MKLLCLSDLHGDLTALSLLAGEIADADLVLVAGDFTDFGGKAEMLRMLEPFMARQGCVAAVPGNCDRAEARLVLEGSGMSMDGVARPFSLPAGEMLVIGAGGGLFRTGLTPYERKEAELVAAFEAALHAQPGPRILSSRLIALTHHPPFDCGADLRRGNHVGSKGLRNILDAFTPMLWVCGHIHEGRSVSMVGSTLVVNPGAVHDGCYARVRIEPGNSSAAVQAELRHL